MTPAEIMANALAEEIFAIGQKLIAKKPSGTVSLAEFWRCCHEVHHIAGPDYRESMDVLKKSGRIKADEGGGITFVG